MNIKRYQNLMKLMQGGKPDKKLILMTATPINTDTNDLKHQVYLLARGHPQYYRSIELRILSPSSGDALMQKRRLPLTFTNSWSMYWSGILALML